MTSASFTFFSTERGSTFECALDGSGFTGCASPRSYANLPDGEHVFRVRATDAAGNTDGSPARRVWTVDTVKPTVKPVSPKPGAKVRDRTPAIKATVRDNHANLRKWNIRLFVAGKEIPRRNFKYNRKTDRLVHSSRKLAPGKKNVRIVAVDRAGNKKVRPWHFKVAR